MAETTDAPMVSGISDEDRRAIELLYQAVGGQPDLLDEAVSPDWEDIPAGPDQKPGPAGFKPIIKAFSAAFPDLKVTIQEVIGAPGRAAVRAEITGTHHGDWLGIAPTGKFTRMRIHEFHHLQNGHITRSWHLEDLHGWMAQVRG